MDTTNEIYTLIQGAERAVDQQRFELAQALATIAQARALADIANAMRDDDDNSVAHILHNMSYNLDAIASNIDAVAAVLTDTDARDSLAQTVAIYGS